MTSDLRIRTKSAGPFLGSPRRLGQSPGAHYDDNTGAWVAHRFIIAVLQKAHPHDPALPHTHILVVLTAERAGNDGRSAVSRELACRLNLNRPAGWAGNYCGHAATPGARRLKLSRFGALPLEPWPLFGGGI